MDIAQIVNQVESPFTDEQIEKLIKTYTECNCNMDEFYKKINLNVEKQENLYLNDLYNRLFSLSNRGERFVDGNNSWDIIGSSKEMLSVPTNPEERVPIYRIYINAKGQDKAKIVEDYIKRCEDAGHGYKLKYSITDGRRDEILILSYGEDLSRNIELIEEITEGMNLGEPAELLGRYKDKIGIGEEYIQAPIYSYTQTRLGLIALVMQKYFLDHREQFDKYLSEKDKKIGEVQLRHFGKISERLLKKIATLPEDKKQQKQELQNEQLAYQNNIDFNIGHMYFTSCSCIPETMQAYMEEHSEEAIPEIIKSYHLACEVFGISKDVVFSRTTQEMIEKQTLLQQRNATLAALEAEAREYDAAEALIGKLEQRQGEDIGE